VNGCSFRARIYHQRTRADAPGQSAKPLFTGSNPVVASNPHITHESAFTGRNLSTRKQARRRFAGGELVKRRDVSALQWNMVVFTTRARLSDVRRDARRVKARSRRYGFSQCLKLPSVPLLGGGDDAHLSVLTTGQDFRSI
jgi:hypothetical protein